MRIHFIAIGGSIMHSLAIELKKNGYIVTGSDDLIREPSKSNLRDHNLFLFSYREVDKDQNILFLIFLMNFLNHSWNL